MNASQGAMIWKHHDTERLKTNIEEKTKEHRLCIFLTNVHLSSIYLVEG